MEVEGSLPEVRLGRPVGNLGTTQVEGDGAGMGVVPEARCQSCTRAGERKGTAVSLRGYGKPLAPEVSSGSSE